MPMTLTAAPLIVHFPTDCALLHEVEQTQGWRVIGVGDPDDVASLMVSGQAQVALVDLRDGAASIEALRQIGAAMAAASGALVVLVEDSEQVPFADLVAAGATHILPEPIAPVHLHAALEGARAVTALMSGMDSPEDMGEDEGGADSLTGLAGRREALDWLDQSLHLPGAHPYCLLVGISQFDAINAAYGSNIGDDILVLVAARIVQAAHSLLGRQDLIARASGTEFLIGLRGEGDEVERDGERPLLLAREIVASLSDPFMLDEHSIRLTARCGIAEGLLADDALRLLRRATAALADARRAGTGNICLRTSDRRGRGLDLDSLGADLRLALGNGEIDVVFQPQYGVVDDKLSGVEALARWDHPRLGRLGAAILFDVADRSDFLLPLSRHIQREALQQAAKWPSSLAHVRLSINVTAADLAQSDFVPQLMGMIADSGFPAERVTVEITESGLIENIGIASLLLQQLQKRGLQVALDDFGTGYSSLAYLKVLQLDYLKIDSGLTHDILGAPRDRIIVRSIISMAKSLSLKVIAEGVENERQLMLLANEGCDVYQGFLRSAGISSHELAALMVEA